jgi:hypothetical protein
VQFCQISDKLCFFEFPSSDFANLSAEPFLKTRPSVKRFCQLIGRTIFKNPTFRQAIFANLSAEPFLIIRPSVKQFLPTYRQNHFKNPTFSQAILPTYRQNYFKKSDLQSSDFANLSAEPF